ncbi:MAG: phosphoenolpyruvate carboxylase [Kiritimatiellia bacterium]
MTKPWMLGDTQMRRDLRLLCWMLRHELMLEGNEEVWSQIVHMRRLAVRHESGDSSADAELARFFVGVPLDQLDQLLRILGIFFDFANVSEDLQRERVLGERRANRRLNDSLDSRLKRFAQIRARSDEQRGLLENLQAEFVFTAHPTEAKRQTVRQILGRIRETLRSLENGDRKTRSVPLQALREDVRVLLRTDPLHPHRPEVLEELDRALFVSDTLWNAAPSLVESVDRALGGASQPLKFGCWIGGDRDGHPHVTVGVTQETLRRLRARALKFHLNECVTLISRLPVRCRNPEAGAILKQIVEESDPPELRTRLARIHLEEHYRRALTSVRVRLEESSQTFAGGVELEQVLERIASAMELDGLTGTSYERLQDWRRRTRVFGLQFMRLDIRENSRGYRSLMKALLPVLGEDPSRVDADRFEGLWEKEFPEPAPELLQEKLDERAFDLLSVTRLMQDWAAEHSPEGIGVNVISMTHCAGDVLWVLWLHRLLQQWRGDAGFAMPIAPLFETIDDLKHASRILGELLDHPVYSAWVREQQGRQTVMVGYSDSAKDGGYLAACWALYEGQERMQKTADDRGIKLTCFHGRGGALGRGGGPAARAIEALPPAEGDAHIRMTEQGEVIADRFADPTLAHRHMEQILGGLVMHAAGTPEPEADWRACMSDFAALGRKAYLELFEREGFPVYFREATPMSCIEDLPIGSRPSRRHGVKSLEDLRAIPYTFSWTQSRQLINAFYGLGTAWEGLNRKQRLVCLRMYHEWPFFKSMIDNAELALTKCDEVIAGEYAKLVEDPAIGEYFGRQIVQEMARTRQAILSMTERPSLMSETAWLRRSVEIRKPFIDVLNHLQIELLRRQRQEGIHDPLQRSLRLSVQGIAAGLRTTG